MSRMLSEGPKVFAFDALTCEALENFDLSVSTADYLQPFPSVVIELPTDYTKKRVVPFEAGSHAPDFVIVRHEPKAGCVMVTMHMTSHQALTRLLKLDPAWTLAPASVISPLMMKKGTPSTRNRRACPFASLIASMPSSPFSTPLALWRSSPASETTSKSVMPIVDEPALGEVRSEQGLHDRILNTIIAR
jgi:hypothetical protein